MWATETSHPNPCQIFCRRCGTQEPILERPRQLRRGCLFKVTSLAAASHFRKWRSKIVLLGNSYLLLLAITISLPGLYLMVYDAGMSMVVPF